MNPAKYQTCGTEIQPATQERTNGLCMTCAKKTDPAFADKVESAKGHVSGKKVSVWEWVKCGLTFLAIGGALWLLIIIGTLIVSGVVVLLARFVFKTSWDTAFFAGAITWLAIKFILFLLGELEWPAKRSRSRDKKPEE